MVALEFGSDSGSHPDAFAGVLMLRDWARRIRRRSEAVESEIRKEIDVHIALHTKQLMSQGLPEDEATSRARARFGDLAVELPRLVASARRRTRRQTRRASLRGIGLDAVVALRQFRRAPVFVAGVVLSLGFGIGVCAIVYSWMRGMVIRPLPVVREVDRLISVTPKPGDAVHVSLDEYREWKEGAHSVSDLAAFAPFMFAVEPTPSSSESVVLYGMFASPNYFNALGVIPATGRQLQGADDQDGSPAVAVIGDEAWRRHFGMAPDVVGRTIRVNNREVRIVGIGPPRFAGHLVMARFDLWLPLSARPLLVPADRHVWTRRDFRWLDVIGRLNGGATLAQADAEFRLLTGRQAGSFPESRGRSARAVPLDMGSAAGQVRPLLVGLMAVTLLIILLICSNVANLILTQATARSRELAVRASLGASRQRLVRQLMTEVSILALAGAIVGIGLASYSNDILASLMPPTAIPLVVWSSLDLAFVGVVLLVTLMCVVACGLAPAVLASRRPPGSILKSNDRVTAQGAHLRATLVISQFGIALAILVVTALFVRRTHDVRSMDLGFLNDDRTLLVQADMSQAGYAEIERWRANIESAAERIALTPGVDAVALGSFVPLGLTGYMRSTLDVPGRPDVAAARERVLVNRVGPQYFDLMGIPLWEGRTPGPEDTPDRPDAVVVNQAFAERYFDGSALGRTFRLGGRSVRVVGIAANSRYDYRDVDMEHPLVYQAWSQAPTPFVTVHIRTNRDRLALLPDVRAALRSVDPELTVTSLQTMREYTSVAFAVAESGSRVLAALSISALLLASMGLFSVISYGTSLRTREFGIRVAVGALPASVAALVVRGALYLAVIGIGAGLITSGLLIALLRSQIAGVPLPRPLEVVGPAILLTACAMIAALLPARRAASLDPMRTLHAD